MSCRALAHEGPAHVASSVQPCHAMRCASRVGHTAP